MNKEAVWKSVWLSTIDIYNVSVMIDPAVGTIFLVNLLVNRKVDIKTEKVCKFICNVKWLHFGLQGKY